MTIIGQGKERTRLQQLIDWCGGPGWDGPLIFDEASTLSSCPEQGLPSSTACAVQPRRMVHMVVALPCCLCQTVGHLSMAVKEGHKLAVAVWEVPDIQCCNEEMLEMICCCAVRPAVSQGEELRARQGGQGGHEDLCCGARGAEAHAARARRLLLRHGREQRPEHGVHDPAGARSTCRVYVS